MLRQTTEPTEWDRVCNLLWGWGMSNMSINRQGGYRESCIHVVSCNNRWGAPSFQFIILVETWWMCLFDMLTYFTWLNYSRTVRDLHEVSKIFQVHNIDILEGVFWVWNDISEHQCWFIPSCLVIWDQRNRFLCNYLIKSFNFIN